MTVLVVARDDGGSAVAPAAGGAPAPPWAAPGMARDAVPAPYLAAWGRARNRAGCALLFPLDGGPGMAGATPSDQKTPDDHGWDVFLTGQAGTVEVLGLFGRDSTLKAGPATPVFTRSWADGSVARYAAEAGNAAPGTFDPDATAVEAVLTVPGQSCAYRIYDSLGRAHLEAIFDRLRLMRG